MGEGKTNTLYSSQSRTYISILKGTVFELMTGDLRCCHSKNNSNK